MSSVNLNKVFFLWINKYKYYAFTFFKKKYIKSCLIISINFYSKYPLLWTIRHCFIVKALEHKDMNIYYILLLLYHIYIKQKFKSTFNNFGYEFNQFYDLCIFVSNLFNNLCIFS